jgi:hypothetical protein
MGILKSKVRSLVFPQLLLIIVLMHSIVIIFIIKFSLRNAIKKKIW